MKNRHDALVAMLLGDAPASPSLARWLASDRGRRELTAYERALAAFDRIVGASPARRGGGVPGSRSTPAARRLELDRDLASGSERSPGTPPPRRAGDTGTQTNAAVRPVYYCAVPSPIGRVFVAASAAGLVRVSFRQSERVFVEALRRGLGVVPTKSRARTGDVVHQLRAYFAGERRAFDVRVDLSGVSPFQREVLMAAASVPAGEVVSYGEIARRIGRPGGSRAVGQALGRNPVPIVIPCHRVIASGGHIGGYARGLTGGLAIKRRLLRLEGALAATG